VAACADDLEGLRQASVSGTPGSAETRPQDRRCLSVEATWSWVECDPGREEQQSLMEMPQERPEFWDREYYLRVVQVTLGEALGPMLAPQESLPPRISELLEELDRLAGDQDRASGKTSANPRCEPGLARDPFVA
jgi:hypothetical protein